MGIPLRVLVVEDCEMDAQLLLRELRRGGFEPIHERVDTIETLSAALETRVWDIVLCDWVLPGMHALAVLHQLKQRGLDLPFMIVSGAIDEEGAVDALRAGAHDFLVKSRLHRLCPAIERERREAGLRADRRKMQEQLLVADRLASLGTVAGGVAHEINNPLTAVLGNLELLERKLNEVRVQPDRATALELTDRVTELVSDAREAGHRIARIVRDLMLFLRSDDRRIKVDVIEVLESSLRIASRQIKERARLERSFIAVPDVQGGETQLGQVFLNLLVNAAQAIPEGDRERHLIRVATRRDDNGGVVVEISDTGCGIAPEHLTRIFDPFYTTKPVGAATGLGLAIGRSIITGLGGDIRVTTEVGKGSTFSVRLPVAERISMTPRELIRSAYSLSPPARRGRVLVVDDEAAIASAVRAMLSVSHDVTIETETSRALARLRAGDRFDVILCDLMMPGLSGMDLYETLAVEVPQQARRMVFITGGAYTYRARTFLEEVQNPRLEKPFSSEQVLSVVGSWAR